MKLSYLFLMALSLNFSAHAEGLYSGEWSGENVIEGSTTSTLTLDMEQNGNKLRGQYCYVSQGGNRIDCPDKGINNLRGVVNGTSAQINFDSTFGGKNGQAVIKLKGDSMEWDLLKKPEGGVFYAPNTYSLIKKNKAVSDSVDKKELRTDKFTITIENKCGSFFSPCGNVIYSGVRNRDGSKIILNGETTNIHGKADGAVFKAGDVFYHIYFNEPRLQVTRGNKVIVNQAGFWAN